MQTKDPVGQFVRDALLADRSRQDIRQALRQAGWSNRDINEALEAFSEGDFKPPIPMPRPQLTAHDVFIYAILFTALTFTAIHLIALVHAILDIALPDPADHATLEIGAARRMRWSIATLIVSAPVYLWMSSHTRQRIELHETHRRSPVRKWLTYITLFVSALTFLGDATVLIFGFLQGEATLRFVLKATVVATVTLAIFAFYLQDVEGRNNET